MHEKVRLLGADVLRVKCHPYANQVPPEHGGLEGLLSSMNETMQAEKGLGLAANQIGWLIRIFILKEEEGYSEYVNPEVLSQEELVVFEGEACLSIPGTFAPTKRFKRLTLSWYDRHGTKREGQFENLRAFAVQHEMDHLDGKLYIDRLGPLRKEMTLDKHRKYMRETRRS